MARQTTVTAVPNKYLAGQLTDGYKYPDIDDVNVDQVASIAPGSVIMRTANGDRAGSIVPAIAALVASVITTKAASGSGAQVLTTADANGSIGAGRISPPAKLTLTLNNHANWLATTGSITYLDENGVPVTESLTIPANGNVALTTAGYASRFIGGSIPQQGGAAATYQLGTSASPNFDGGDVLGVAVLSQKALVSPAEDNNELYEQGTTMPVLKRGRIAVVCENSFRAGDVPMIRFATGTGTVIGAIRAHDNDSGTCAPWRRARFTGSGNAGDVGEIDVFLR